jgi:ATP-dependent DNA helicase RecG
MKFGGFSVIFRKDVYTEDYLRTLGLNERQIEAVVYVKEKERITNKEYQELTGVSRQMATIELKDLVGKGVFLKVGKAGRGIAYQLTQLPNK